MDFFTWVNVIIMTMVAFLLPFLNFTKQQLQKAGFIAASLFTVPLIIAILFRHGATIEDALMSIFTFERGITSLLFSISYGMVLGLMLQRLKSAMIQYLKKQQKET